LLESRFLFSFGYKLIRTLDSFIFHFLKMFHDQVVTEVGWHRSKIEMRPPLTILALDE
jgi:hypothetical protein